MSDTANSTTQQYEYAIEWACDQRWDREYSRQPRLQMDIIIERAVHGWRLVAVGTPDARDKSFYLYFERPVKGGDR